MNDGFAAFDFTANGYTIRRERHEGVEHIVAPVVILTEGVHRGSGGAIFYSADELAKMPAIWNGRPLPVRHPDRDGTPISAMAQPHRPP